MVSTKDHTRIETILVLNSIPQIRTDSMGKEIHSKKIFEVHIPELSTLDNEKYEPSNRWIENRWKYLRLYP